jgi:hypothetical protein
MLAVTKRSYIEEMDQLYKAGRLRGKSVVEFARSEKESAIRQRFIDTDLMDDDGKPTTKAGEAGLLSIASRWVREFDITRVHGHTDSGPREMISLEPDRRNGHGLRAIDEVAHDERKARIALAQLENELKIALRKYNDFAHRVGRKCLVLKEVDAMRRPA